MSSNLNVIGSIAASLSAEDKLGDMIGGNAGEALRGAMEKAREQQQEELGTALLAMLTSMRETRRELVQQIRNSQREIASRKVALDNLTRALDYGQATNNFVPLAHQLGLGPQVCGRMTQAEYKELREIPKGWTAPTEG